MSEETKPEYPPLELHDVTVAYNKRAVLYGITWRPRQGNLLVSSDPMVRVNQH